MVLVLRARLFQTRSPSFRSELAVQVLREIAEVGPIVRGEGCAVVRQHERLRLQPETPQQRTVAREGRGRVGLVRRRRHRHREDAAVGEPRVHGRAQALLLL
eukprot:9482217-Lingulodinium_polyedra.AAC.1